MDWKSVIEMYCRSEVLSVKTQRRQSEVKKSGVQIRGGWRRRKVVEECKEREMRRTEGKNMYTHAT